MKEMCLLVYIASDRELPVLPWKKEKPAFHVSDLAPQEGVIEQFSKPHLKYLGSDQGCGCGFMKEYKEEKEFRESLKNYEDLADYIDSNLEVGEKIEVFSFWDGEQYEELEGTHEITNGTLREPDFEFKERHFYHLTKKYNQAGDDNSE